MEKIVNILRNKYFIGILLMVIILSVVLLSVVLGVFLKSNDKLLFNKIYGVTFSSNGENIAYVGKKVISRDYGSFGDYSEKSEEYVIQDGEIISNDIGTQGFIGKKVLYSPSGDSFSYVNKKWGKFFIVKDGVKLGRHDYIKDFKYFGDGKDFSYLAIDNGEYFVVKDGIESDHYDGERLFKKSQDGKSFFDESELNSKNRVYSPDGKSYASIDIDPIKKEVSVVVNGVKGKKYNKKDGFINLGDIRFSPDGKSYAYIVHENGETFVVKDGIEGKRYKYTARKKRISDLGYSFDGKSFIYKVRDHGSFEDIIILNDFELAEFQAIRDLNFMQDNSLMYIGTDDLEDVVFRGSFNSQGNYVEEMIMRKNEKHIYKRIEKIIYSGNGKDYALIVTVDSEGNGYNNKKVIFK